MAQERPQWWAEAERDFRLVYNAQPTTLPRQRVHYRCVEGGPIPTTGSPLVWAAVRPLLWVGTRLLSRRMMNEDLVMALWSDDAAAGTPAALIFEVDRVPIENEGDAVLVGQLAINGALCLEMVDGSVVWPTYNPRTPMRGAPRR